MFSRKILAKKADTTRCNSQNCSHPAAWVIMQSGNRSKYLCFACYRIFKKANDTIELNGRSVDSLPLPSSELTQYIAKTERTNERIKYEQDKLRYTIDV